MYNVAGLTKKVEDMISDVRNGASSKYTTIVINEDTDVEENVTIRVSNHKANPQRVSGKTIIFVIPDAESEIEAEAGSFNFNINKKSFSRVAGTYELDENNCDENGNDIEYLLDYEIN